MEWRVDACARAWRGRRVGPILRLVSVVLFAVLALTAVRAGAWFDDIERGTNGWTHYWISGAGIPDNWAISTTRFHSPVHSWYSGVEVVTGTNGGDTALESPTFDLTNATTSYLNFWHWYYFDYSNASFYPDGGIVELNAGAGWTQITPIGGYDGTLSVGYNNPIEGLPAFVALSGGWIQESFNISAYVGTSVQIRFHVGWDYGSFGAKEGWYIDDIEVTNATLPAHDLAITPPGVPGRVGPNTDVSVGGLVANAGTSDETNVLVNFTVDGALTNSTTVPFLQNGTASPISFLWTPVVERTYQLCLEVAPAPGETLTANNVNCATILVLSTKGFLLVDQTHSTDPIGSYSLFISDLLAVGYAVENLTVGPISAAALAGHDVLIVPQAHATFGPSELSAIQAFVSGGGGLFVIGDDIPTIYVDLTSFAGISWTSGGTAGTTTSITPHQITTGVTSVSLPAPVSALIVGGFAISLVRDPAGANALVVSDTPGRVAGISDEDAVNNGGIASEDNAVLAVNIVDWLLGTVYAHDIAVANLNAPRRVDVGQSFFVNATIRNAGLTNESSVTVDFSVDGVLQSNVTIPSLSIGASQAVSFPHSTTAQGSHRVEISVRPIPNENYTGNNAASRAVWVGSAVLVAVYDHGSTSDISYFTGGNFNLYVTYQAILDSDPEGRFVTLVITDLSAATLSGFDALVLPDNAVPDAFLPDVAGFFANRGGIVGVDSAVCYLAYSGVLWPGAAGTSGYNTYWTYGSRAADQRILMGHDITADYIVGDVYESNPGDAGLFLSSIPPDAVALTGSASSPGLAYVAAREEPGGGRVAALGPFGFPTLPPQLFEMVRDAVFWASGGTPMAHNLVASTLQFPRYVQPGDSVTVLGTIRNAGQNNETNVLVNLTVDGSLINQTTVPLMTAGQIDTLSFTWNPTAERRYTVCLEVAAVAGENATLNNRLCRDVDARTIKAFVLFDQTHGSIGMASYSALTGVLISQGYAVDPLTTSPLTSSALSGYDVLVLPRPFVTYAGTEQSVLESFVSSGHGMLLMGDYDSVMYSGITSFAGISWRFGGRWGTTFDITVHEVTQGVASVYLPDPYLALSPTGGALTLIRDVVGDPAFAVSESPGRVAALTDEYAFSDPFLNTSDNLVLVENLIAWLSIGRDAHDLRLEDVSVPSPLERWSSYAVSADVRNVGRNDETNVRVRLLLDGTPVDTVILSSLAVDETRRVTLNLVPGAVGSHDVSLEAIPVTGENQTDDNAGTRRVDVQDTRAPGTPTDLRVRNAATDPTALELTWSPTADPDLAYYAVYLSLDGATFFLEARVPSGSENYTDEGLLAGTKYFYQVSASDDIPNESPHSAPAAGMPGPDTDHDGIPDALDPDDDNDGVPDDQDAFPLDPQESRDFDHDGIGDVQDPDDDNDGVPDVGDPAPFDATRSGVSLESIGLALIIVLGMLLVTLVVLTTVFLIRIRRPVAPPPGAPPKDDSRDKTVGKPPET